MFVDTFLTSHCIKFKSNMNTFFCVAVIVFIFHVTYFREIPQISERPAMISVVLYLVSSRLVSSRL